MANEVLFKTGVQWLFADHATDFGAAPTTTNNSLIVGTPTDVQIDLTGVAASGGDRASAKATLATPWASFSVDACIEFAVAPTDGGTVDFYWAPSPSSTAAQGNPGGLTGADEAPTVTAGIQAQMIFIGSLVVRNNVINIGHVGIITPPYEYGMLLVTNNADQALAGAGSMDETHIVMTELITEIQ